MIDPLAALTGSPRVVVVDGEIVLMGDRMSVSYTPEAARELALRLQHVLDGLNGVTEA